MNALVAFDAAARHESLSLAGLELHVTAGAVGRQVKKLEEHLGQQLFARVGRNIVLTDEGRGFHASLGDIFLRLRQETERIRNRNKNRPLTVRSSMMFMRYWLLPRLPTFFQAHEGVELAFSVGRSGEIVPPEVDVAIRMLLPPDMPPGARRMLTGRMLAVASPRYLAGSPPIATMEDLRSHSLLHSSVHPDQWAQWVGKEHQDVVAQARNVVLVGDGLGYEAASEGLGIALARECLIKRELKSGQFIIPLRGNEDAFGDYYIVPAQEKGKVRGLAEFTRWLADTARAEAASDS